MVIWGMVYYYLPTLFEIIWVSFGVVEDWHRAWRFFFSMRVIFFVPSWSHWIVELSLQSPCLFVKQCLCWSIHDLRSSKHPNLSSSRNKLLQHVTNITQKIPIPAPDAPRQFSASPGAPCRVAHFGQRPRLRLAEFPAVHGVPGTRRSPRCHHGAQVQGPKVFVEVVMGIWWTFDGS